MSEWLEHSCQVEVAVNVDHAWALWSNLEQMPRWMPWIRSVQVQAEAPEFSRWTLAAQGVEFSWQSRVTRQIPNQIIQWESVDGLPNRGAIRFYERGPGRCIVRLSIAYQLPTMLQLLDNLVLGRFVESTLQADLDRFRRFAEAEER